VRAVDAVALALAATCSAGCFIKPDRPGVSADASGDGDAAPDGSGSGSGAAPVARKIADAYYSSAGASNGMSQAGYSVPVGSIPDGDLLLFLANVDNGNNTVWMLPPGFTQLHQIYYGNDGETFVAGWKIANNEPATYAESYGTGINSGAAVITILAVSGVDAAHPIETSAYTIGSRQTQSPASVTSSGVATTAANSLLVFAGGVDWEQPDPLATATFTEPVGFLPLEELSDGGGITFDWTTLVISSMAVADPGAAVPRTATIASNPVRTGIPWAVEIAIAPR
jgi:hypothetical protein